MNSWPDLEKLLLAHLRKRGPLSPEVKRRLLEDSRAMMDSILGATRRAQYGPVKTDSIWFSTAEIVKTAEELTKESPKKAKAIADISGRVLWLAASERKLREVAAALDMLDSTEAFNPLHLKVLEAYTAAMPTDGSPPTIAELRAEWKYAKGLLPKGFSLRKMVGETLKLPVGRAKLGRPRIRNPRR